MTSLPEAILVVVALLLPLFGYLFFRRMRTIQREKIEARYQRLHEDILNGMDPEDREDFLRLEAAKDSTSKSE